MCPNPVLLFHPDAVTTRRPDLKGRHAAGDSFLSAFLARATGTVYGLCTSDEHARQFRARVGRAADLSARPVGRLDVAVLRQQGVLHLPDPGLAREADLRAMTAEPTAYALCGLTHSVSSERVLTGFSDLVASRVEPWDALICTSPAVRAVVERAIDEREELLRARTGVVHLPRPKLPVIPLGVDTTRFAPDPDARRRWRQRLQIEDDAVVVLYVGRLSAHAKASPLQLAQAVHRAAERVAPPLVVIWCGWFHDEFQRRVFLETAQAMAPDTRFVVVDGRAPEARFSIWSAGDIFCSLSDNVQESFGLTVAEAMAAGLPVVVSNWDGYRGTVRHGVDGILVDTYLAEGPLSDTYARYVSGVDTYDRFVGGLSQLCFVDLRALVDAIAELTARPELRRRLGEAARVTAAKQFDWSVVLPRYEALWSEQVDDLRAATADTGAFRPLPRPDPARWFASYPSRRLHREQRLGRGRFFEGRATWVARPGVLLHPQVLGTESQYRRLQTAFEERGERTVADLVAAEDPAAVDALLRTLHWLVKVGILELLPPSG